MKVEIVDAKIRHCGQITRSLRVDHAATLMRMDVQIHRELRHYFDTSYYKRSAFIDGHLVAVGGCQGSLISSSGFLWLALSQYAMKFPVAVLRYAKREIEHLAKTKTELRTTLLPDDVPAQRLAAFLGFEAVDGFGGGRAQDRRGRGLLMNHWRSNPDFMVAAGSAQQIPVFWRRGE